MKRYFQFLKREPWLLTTFGLIFSVIGLRFALELPKLLVYTIHGFGLILILIGAFFVYSKTDISDDDETED